MKDPHLLISLQEFGAILEGKGYRQDFKKGLTDMFNAGRFEDALSSRKSKELRICEWFFPTVYGAVQPEVLRKAGRSLDVAQGLFSRFLIGFVSDQDEKYDLVPDNRDFLYDSLKIKECVFRISKLKGVVGVQPGYNVKFSAPIRDVIDKKMIPLVLRYANEYLPRIALMLAIPAEIDDHLRLPELTEEHFRRATVVLHWILGMAERALGTLSDLEGRNRQLEEGLWKMVKMLEKMSSKGEKITIANISRNSSGTGWDSKAREEILNEMSAREWISIKTPAGPVMKVVKGCSITLNEDKLPPGIC